MHVGTILIVNDFPTARNPAYQLTIDFEKLSEFENISPNYKYSKEDLINRQIVAVVNFQKKQIGNFMSECLMALLARRVM
jgi:tRNA-binding protein